MKAKVVMLTVLMSANALAAGGTISVLPAANRENTLALTIYGDAAKLISKQLSINGVVFHRDHFSGALVQNGKGVRCIDKHNGQSLYCYISITGKSVN